MPFPDDSLKVLQWADGTWHHLDFADWAKLYRGRPSRPLPYATAGDKHFVVCVVEDGRLLNILPHRCRIDRQGNISEDFGVLSDEEAERYRGLHERHHEHDPANPLTDEEEREFDAIRDRLWRAHLPPREAMLELTCAATALPDEHDAAWVVLEACGISRN